MNDDNKIVNQTTPPVAVPTGSMQKEQGPVRPGLTDFMKPAGTEVKHEISDDQKEVGVEEKTDNLNLTDQHKEIGMNHAGATIPVSTAPMQPIQYPMSETEMLEKLKAGNSDDSGKWLTTLIKKIKLAFAI